MTTAQSAQSMPQTQLVRDLSMSKEAVRKFVTYVLFDAGLEDAHERPALGSACVQGKWTTNAALPAFLPLGSRQRPPTYDAFIKQLVDADNQMDF